MCQWRSLVSSWAWLSGHALSAQIVQHRLKDTFREFTGLNEAIKLSSLGTARKSSEDTAILTNARSDQRKRLWLDQQLHGFTTL